MAEVVEMVQRKGLVLSPGCSIKVESPFHFHLTKRGRKQMFTERRVSDPVPWLFVGLKGTGQVDRWPLYLRK